MDKERRRNKGTGSVYKKRDGYSGYLTINGIREYFDGDTQEEVEEKILLRRAELIKLNGNNPNQRTFLQYSENYMMNVFRNLNGVGPTTFERNMSIYRTHLKDAAFANKKIKNITYVDIQNFFDNLRRKDNNSNEELLHISSVKKIHQLLRRIFKRAVKEDLIFKNPAEDISYPKTRKIEKKKKKYSKEELKKIMKVIKKDENQCLFTLEIITGLRHSEIVGLTWDNVDLKKKTITINRILRRYKDYGPSSEEHENKWIEKDPKSDNSKRILTIDNNMVSLLKNHYDKEVQKFKDLNLKNKRNLVFTNEKGEPIMPNKLLDETKRICEEANLPYITFHGFRHTFGSVLYLSKIDIKLLSVLLGHADIETTLNSYVHLDKNDIKKSLDNLRKQMNSDKGLKEADDFISSMIETDD